MAIECVTLRDPQSPATATIAVGFGFNCFDFQVNRQGTALPILWAASDFADGTARASGSGIPLLFPFPGRLHGTTFRWDGKDYELPAGDGRGNPIHGFVLNRAWRVVDQSTHRVSGEFHATRDDPSLRKMWPADFRIRVEYELSGERLSCQITVDNPDQQPLPCGLGTHPYFRVPLGGADPNACIVQLPVTTQWELEDMVTTGRTVSVPNAAALQQGQPFRDLQFDTVFSGLIAHRGRVMSSLYDPNSRVLVEQSWDSGFRECVVYTPQHREAICIEPYSCAPGFLELHRRGIDSGMTVLAPGAALSLNVAIQVR